MKLMFPILALLLPSCEKRNDRCYFTVDLTGRMCAVEVTYDGKMLHDTIIGRYAYTYVNGVAIADTLPGTARYNLTTGLDGPLTIRVAHLRPPAVDSTVTVRVTGDCHATHVISADSVVVVSGGR